jgi:hypothetical protein
LVCPRHATHTATTATTRFGRARRDSPNQQSSNVSATISGAHELGTFMLLAPPTTIRRLTVSLTGAA